MKQPVFHGSSTRPFFSKKSVATWHIQLFLVESHPHSHPPHQILILILISVGPQGFSAPLPGSPWDSNIYCHFPLEFSPIFDQNWRIKLPTYGSTCWTIRDTSLDLTWIAHPILASLEVMFTNRWKVSKIWLAVFHCQLWARTPPCVMLQSLTWRIDGKWNHLKMYFLLNMGMLQAIMLVFIGVTGMILQVVATPTLPHRKFFVETRSPSTTMVSSENKSWVQRVRWMSLAIPLAHPNNSWEGL